jgi:hypothetical protein
MPIGRITVSVKLAGEPDAGKQHVRFEAVPAVKRVEGLRERDIRLEGEELKA